MKIESYKIYKVSIPTRRRHTWASSTADVGQGWVILEVKTDDGIVGYGEATTMPEWGGDFGRYYGESYETTEVVIRDNLFPAIMGMDPFDIDLIHHRMDKAIRGFVYAKAAIDIALYDIMGKALDKPVYKLLGGQHRKAIPIAHSLGVVLDIEAAVDEAVAACGEGSTAAARRELEMRVPVMPHLRQDDSDRNRTSPFAFTGNKFEFRMLGSSQSISDPNTVLNTAVAEVLGRYADRLEQSADREDTVRTLLQETLEQHGRILFNGDGYSEEWQQEAERRGLLNLRTAPEAFAHLTEEKNVALFAKHGIFTAAELTSRQEIHYETYAKCIRIEAATMAEMVRRQILPAGQAALRELGQTSRAKQEISPLLSCKAEELLGTQIANYNDMLLAGCTLLENLLRDFPSGTEEQKALYARDRLLPAMNELRQAADLIIAGKPVYQGIWMDQILEKLPAEEIVAAPYYNGDAVTMIDENPDLAFYVPKEGTNLFVDAMCIPKNAKNVEGAEKFINFMCSTEAAMANWEYIGYSSPHTGVYEQLDEETKQRRAEHIMELQAEVSAAREGEKVGQTLECICDGVDDETGMYMLRTKADCPEIDGNVLTPADTPLETGAFYKVTITDSDTYDLYGYAEERLED